MWLANSSQPDISNAVRSVTRRAHDDTRQDRRAMTKILVHLRGTKVFGFKLAGNGEQLVACADSNNATYLEYRKSVSEGVMIYEGQLYSMVF